MLRRILMLSEVEMSVRKCAYVFATVTWQSVIINRVERAHFILMSVEIGNQQPFLRLHTVLGVKSRAGPEYSIIRIFVRWVGIRFSILRFEFRISFFFFFTPGIPRGTVLNLSAWLNICTSNRPFANERRSC